MIETHAPLCLPLFLPFRREIFLFTREHTQNRYGCSQRFRCCFARLVFSSPRGQKREDDDEDDDDEDDDDEDDDEDDDDDVFFLFFFFFFFFCHDHQCETKRRNHRPESHPTKSRLELFRNVRPVLEIPRPRERLYSRGQSRVGRAENLSRARGVVVR